MKKIILSILLFISIGIAAQEKEKIEKFQIEATGTALYAPKEKIAFKFSAAYDFNSFLRAGLEGMFWGKTATYNTIQKYTVYFDMFSETRRDYGVSFGPGLSYLYSPNGLNTAGIDIRAKLYYHLISNLYLTLNMSTTFAKKGDLIMPQLGIGLMYRF